MTGMSPLSVTEAQRDALTVSAGSRDRGEADRARAVLLTPAGWTSPRIAGAFGVREDTVRLWRSDFMNGGVEALKAPVAPGPAPVKSEAALRDLKAHYLVHQTFADADALDRAIHRAVDALNRERMALPLAKLRISA